MTTRSIIRHDRAKRWPYILILISFILLPASTPLASQNSGFSMADVLSYPFPNELTTAATGNRIAWAMNENGLRNIYVAEGPDFQARQLTNYSSDDGQELSSVSLSADGKWVVYIRGGDFGSNWDDAEIVNPTFAPNPPEVQIWSIPFAGGEAVAIGNGENPSISPQNDRVAFVKGGQIWTVPIDGSSSAEKLFSARGSNSSPTWSPDGSMLAFRSNRSDHAFIGIYKDRETPIHWVVPSFNRDYSPSWSPSGSALTFVRRPGGGGAPGAYLKPEHNAWQVMTYDLVTKKLKQLWKAPETLRGSVPTTQGGTNLHWANGRVVFLSYHDGWPHLYSVPENGGPEKLLTPGNFMAEYISLSPDRNWLYFAGNTGSDPLDIDRRHVVRVHVDGSGFEVLTNGAGLEWTPHITGDGLTCAYISATAKRPPVPAVMNLQNRQVKMLGEDRIPANFPTQPLVTPIQVTFESLDGTLIHGTLFNHQTTTGKKPAIIYIHGGPPRQMLLGWHYSSYYSNAYAVNQYLASQGYIVLSVNYRLGIGYGYEFHRPPDGGTRGASEYQDIKAAGLWLASQPNVNADQIGVYGGSYGGYLTAMALGRDSDLFAAGVDIHGVHDRTINRTRNLVLPDRYEHAEDAEYASRVAWRSSPVSSVDTWTSPVMIIHADDDRNVSFSQSTDLVRRLEKKGVELETLVIVDDTHHFMMHANQLKVNESVADFFQRHFSKAK